MFKLSNLIVAIAFGYLCIIITGCSSYTPYRYSFLLIESQNEKMNFEDDHVQFRFVPTSENVLVSIKNKTDNEINLVRDDAEYIDHTGESHMVHYGDNYVDEVQSFSRNNRYVTPIKIEPGSEIAGNVWINIWPDFCIGDGRHSFKSYQIDYLMEPLLPRHSFEGNGKSLKGSTFNMILPIDFGDYVNDYTFTFKIDDVI